MNVNLCLIVSELLAGECLCHECFTFMRRVNQILPSEPELGASGVVARRSVTAADYELEDIASMKSTNVMC